MRIRIMIIAAIFGVLWLLLATLLATAAPIDLGDIAEDDTIYFYWSTNDSDGAGVAASVAGTVQVYKDDNTTQITAGITDTRTFDTVTGLNMCKIDLSASADYATGSSYHVVLTGATIDSVSGVVAVLARFTIEDRYVSVDEIEGTDATDAINTEADTALTDYDPPTNAEMEARTLVAASYFDPAADTVANVTTVATLTGHTAQTGDSYVEVTDASYGLDQLCRCTLPVNTLDVDIDGNVYADVQEYENSDASDVWAARTLAAADYFDYTTDGVDVTTIENVDASNEIDTAPLNALIAYKLDHLVAVADGDDPVNGSIIAELASATEDWSTFVAANDSLEAAADAVPTTSEITTAIKAMTIDGQTFENLTAWQAAMLLGTISGANTNQATIKQVAGTTTRVVMTTDAYGNRYTVTLTAP